MLLSDPKDRSNRRDVREALQSADPYTLQCRNLLLDCRKEAHVVGILNVTPDSFSDGGRYLRVEDALRRAVEMAQEGARAIDVGGASSRPRGKVYGAGASAVPAEEEMRRVLPVIKGIARELPLMVLSVDTYRPEVAAAALEAGAHMINDISGLRHRPEMAHGVAANGAALVLMHAIGRPGSMPHQHTYADVVAQVCTSLEKSVHIARTAGVKSLVVDPGFGFGKTAVENLRLISRLDALCRLGPPVMVGISRKSTIGQVLGSDGVPAPVSRRLFGSLGVTALAVIRGARLVRTHDVQATVDMIRALRAAMSF